MTRRCIDRGQVLPVLPWAASLACLRSIGAQVQRQCTQPVAGETARV